MIWGAAGAAAWSGRLEAAAARTSTVVIICQREMNRTKLYQGLNLNLRLLATGRRALITATGQCWTSGVPFFLT